MQQVTLLDGMVERTEGHDYFVWLDDVKLGPFPSVTRLLRTDRPWYTEASAARGQAVHELTEDFDVQGMVASPEEYQGYLDAYQGFHRDFGDRLSFDLIEEPFVARAGGLTYGGTLDRLGAFDGERAVFDIKSGGATKDHALQLAAYGVPHGATLGMAIYVKKTGLYKVEVFHDLERLFEEFLGRATDGR